MAYRRSVGTPRVHKPNWKKATRIKIPQPPEISIILRGDLLRGDLISPELSDFILHRRGLRRGRVGVDPKEQRAVSENEVRGYLHERIVYKYLVEAMGFVPDVDFDFQSSQLGGRLEMGGLVVDFLFPLLKIVLQVQGPTHYEFRRGRKDEEQRMILEDMGYAVHDIDIAAIIANEYLFEDEMRRIFGLRGVGGSVYGDQEMAEDAFWYAVLERLEGLGPELGRLYERGY